jgi:hypothetical protein
METKLQSWDARFPGCAPIGSHLRVAFPERWVRFHYLPGSKRYPDDEAEIAEALHRYEVVLDDLNHSRQAVVLVTTGYSNSNRPTRSYPILSQVNDTAVPWRTVQMEDIGENSTFWHFCVSTHVWKPLQLSTLLRLVIVNELANLLVVADDCSWVFYPYQGGMDVIVGSEKRRDELAQKHAAWIPGSADGL